MLMHSYFQNKEKVKEMFNFKKKVSEFSTPYTCTRAIKEGGMETKLKAAKIATEAGCDMIIANGSAPELLYDIVEGKSVGTRFFS